MRHRSIKDVLGFIALGFLIPTAIKAAEVPSGQPFQALQSQVNTLQSGVTGLQSSVNNLGGSVTTLESNIADLQGRIAELERITSQTFALTCGAGMTISDAVKLLKPGDTLRVSGTCSENVTIPENVSLITLDGQGSASVSGPDVTSPTFSVRGKGITLKGFTITGGQDAVTVTRGGAAIIDGNLIQNAQNGVSVTDHSAARVINNTIQNNSGDGVSINQNSSGRIGIFAGDDSVASPNIIRSNGNRGVVVTRASNGVIVGNNISNNVSDGINVVRSAQADVSSNNISGNGRHGILVNSNSAVNLGNDLGNGIFDAPNVSTANNLNRGILCLNGGIADGRLGTLAGSLGNSSFDATCINSLIP